MRVGPNGRDLKSPEGNSDRATGANLCSSRLLHVLGRFRRIPSFATMPAAWAEDRALPGSNPSAVPGANTEWGGAMPPSAIRDWHRSAKSRTQALLRAPLLSHASGSGGGTRPARGIDQLLAQHVPD